MADNRLLVDVSLISLSVTGYNNYMYFNPFSMPYGYKKLSNQTDQTATDYLNNSNNWKIISADSTKHYKDVLKSGNLFVYENQNQLSRNVFYNHEIALLNFMISLNRETSFSFGIKQRTFVNADRVSSEIIELAINSLEVPDLWLKDLNNQEIKFGSNSWNEYDFGLASVIYDEKQHFVKSGFTIKVLQGLGAAFVSTDDFEYNLKNGDTTLLIAGTFDYGYSENLEVETYGNDISPSTFGLNLNTPFKGAGWGLGADLGVVYEWRPDWTDYKYDMDNQTNLWRADQNKYRIRAALSVNDIGGIRYKRGSSSRGFKLNVTDPFDLANIEDSESLVSFNQNIDSIVQTGQATYIPDNGTFFMNIPTHINANVDYSVVKNVYLKRGRFCCFWHEKQCQ